MINTYYNDAGRWKTLGGPVVIGGDNLPSPVWIGLTDLQNIGGGRGPPGPPPRFRHHCMYSELSNKSGVEINVEFGHYFHLCRWKNMELGLFFHLCRWKNVELRNFFSKWIRKTSRLFESSEYVQPSFLGSVLQIQVKFSFSQKATKICAIIIIVACNCTHLICLLNMPH